MKAAAPRFHLAIPVDDLSAAEAFYAGVLQCRIGRADANWIDFDFGGHQLSVHRVAAPARAEAASPVDGERIGVPHFGLVLDWAAWEALIRRLESCRARFELEPTIRFRGAPGEQATAFLRDPAGNLLEFKAFRDPARLFARVVPDGRRARPSAPARQPQ